MALRHDNTYMCFFYGGCENGTFFTGLFTGISTNLLVVQIEGENIYNEFNYK